MPLGVGTAIYLEEYADKERWYNRLLEVNIQNLAAVPSIVYGILGLAFLVRGHRARACAPRGRADPHAARAADGDHRLTRGDPRVPNSIRQGAYALGATKWQVVRRQVLPAAIPGIATGSILACPARSARRRR